ncbi:MAG: ATP-binding protein, partial [Desulfobacteraceae bacterium]|nr:ATP-binding protein [Desulfobacteraceae bacterium]
QVFANIFENIVRYADSPGTVMVVGEVANDHINIFIEDTGPGVAEASLNRLFDRLYRTDLARTRESGGSGLGLSICKSIIEAHQGRIWAENVDSGGLRIVIELPISK